jgi:hypothetical protein
MRIFLIKVVVLGLLFIKIASAQTENQALEKNQLSLNFAMPVTLLLNAFYLSEASLLLKYDRDFDRIITGIEFGELDYFVVKGAATENSSEMTISSKEVSLLFKYKINIARDLNSYRVFIGYGFGKGNGKFSSPGARGVDVSNLDYQPIQIGLEALQVFKTDFFYSVIIKYKTIFYNDSRIPSFWNNKRVRFESIPSLGAGIGWHF